MRIICLIPQMGPGGAERAMAMIANYLSARHQVVLLTWEPPGTQPFHGIADAVRFVPADLLGGRGLARLWRVALRAPRLRGVVRETRADVVLSFIDTANITAVASCIGMKVSVVVSERIDPAQHRTHWLLRTSRLALYTLADRTVVQTNRVAAYFPRWMQGKIAVVPNPLGPATGLADPGAPGPGGRFRVVAMGRLEHQKGFDRLIDAFATIARRYPLWDVIIFGEGGEREALRKRARDAGLTSRVMLAGVTQASDRELAASHIMAFPSRYEGFPNALGEALRAGLPAVGYEAVSGVEELISNGTTGFLVPADAGPAVFANALERLIEDGDLRRRMGTAAAARAARWSSETVLAQWEDLLLRVTSGARQSAGRVDGQPTGVGEAEGSSASSAVVGGIRTDGREFQRPPGD